MNTLPVALPTRRPGALAGAMLILVLVGCSSSGARSFDGTPATTRGSGNELAAEQLRDIEGTSHSAYEAIRALRPQWLRIRSTPSPVLGTLEPVVYVDRLRYGDLASLQSIATSNIERIRYVPGLDATTRYGTDHGGGVIEIVLR